MAKNIILCFDGTCNDPEDAEQKTPWYRFGEPEDASITNVFKLHLIFGGDLRDGQHFQDQSSLYYSGVGTYGGTLKRAFNAGLAPENKDVGRIIRDGMHDLKAFHRPGDQVFIFGFSRGAAIGRRFAAVLPEFFPKGKHPNIRFMGMFDTVASIGKPNLSSSEKPISDVVFENGSLANTVEEALHLVALDEKRKAFQPTLMNKEGRATEVWFAGAHSDVGGGYRYDGLADNALQFMLNEVIRRKLGIKLLMPPLVDYEGLAGKGADAEIDYDDVIVQPNPYGKLHQQKRTPVLTKLTLADRLLRVNVNDEPSPDRPVVHQSVIDRLHNDRDYRPASLRRRPHLVWKSPSEAEEFPGLKSHLLLGVAPLKELALGEPKSVIVHANQKRNHSGLLLVKGNQYVFKVPAGQVWYDSGIDTTPKGWNRKTEELGLKEILIQLTEGRRRCPDADWFEVIGGVGENDDLLFRILKHLTPDKAYSPKTTGVFFAFANDLDRFYDNNLGSIEVEVKCIA